jgi:hypothetical protein
VYDVFNSIADAKAKYKRCRTVKHFILSDAAIASRAVASKPCAHCGKPIGEFPDDEPEGYRGNRCEYFPRAKKVVLLHYTCAWESLFNRIYDVARMF